MGQKKRTAAEVIGNLGGWENKWKWNPGEDKADDHPGPSSASSHSDNRALQQQLDTVRGQLKRFQADADRETQRQNAHRDVARDGPPKKKSKGKGRGKGQDQGGARPWQNKRSGSKGGGSWRRHG